MKDLPDDLETFLLLALSDSNLPTGGFVASSGLESTCLHGFLPLHYDLEAPATLSTVQSVVAFIDKSLTSYSRLAMAFVNDAHDLVCSVEPNDGFRQAREELVSLSTLHDAMLLNHVARRASKAQGAALLSLYVRSFAPPLPESGIKRPIDQLVDEIRISIRSGSFEAHLPVCWGILCAAVGLSAEKTRHLHLFLHARSILSSAVRLNLIGPYLAHRELLHAVQPLVTKTLIACSSATTKGQIEQHPVTIWPLQEILATRHDCIHSRIFNS